MKKNLFLLSVAMLALTACNNDAVLEENTSANLPKEIALQAIATPATRAAVDGTDFPDTLKIKVAAYDVTAQANYFAPTSFTNVESTTTWTGDRYWPFTPDTINFLAYAEYANVSPSWGSTNPASTVTLAMSDNSVLQNDVMYACGTGSVSQNATTSALTFPTNVGMTFKHAQAWIQFNVTAGSDKTVEKMSVNSITLNNVSCTGEYVVTHTNWNSATPAPSVAGNWFEYDGSNIKPIAAVKNSGFTFRTTGDEFGNLLVVPNAGMASFTINYTLDGNTYNYTYTPASTTLAQATKYIYNITLTVHEIVVAPEVVDWSDGGSTAVGI